MEKSIAEIRSNNIIDGLEPLMGAIAEKLLHISPEDAINYYADTKNELMSSKHNILLEECVHFDMEERFPSIIKKLKQLKLPPKPMFKEATFRSEKVNTLTIPEDMCFDILDAETDRTEYRFDINENTVYWLAEMLETEVFYLVKYDRITVTGE